MSEIRQIRVEASVSYDVLIGKGLLDSTGRPVRDLGNVSKVLIVSDDNVFPLYGERVNKSLQKEGLITEQFVFPHGEQSKSLAVYEQLLEYLCERHLNRSDLLIALGGGVTGDLTGFAAATYQRGIRFVQVPTTLLAAVDSSVGGKTAVNLQAGKNQVGCFYQPSLVICDTETLDTLPESEYRAGCAEVIKYGMINNSAFFDKLEQKSAKEWISEVIAVCVGMKRDVVMHDEFDRGERMLLNFGHTLGHGVEKCSAYTTAHGFAVAMGMALITRAAEQKGICPAGSARRLTEVLQKYGLPTEIPYSAEDLAKAAATDKKNAGDRLNIIVPEKIGTCVIRNIPASELIDWIHEGGID